jgi:hypothetical protein
MIDSNEARCKTLEILLRQLPEEEHLVRASFKTGAAVRTASFIPPHEQYVRNGMLEFEVETIGPIDALALGDRPKQRVPHARKLWSGVIVDVDDKWVLRMHSAIMEVL